MFANEITDKGQPICLICKTPVLSNNEVDPGPQRGDLVQTPTGLWIMHQGCIEAYNASVISDLERGLT